MLEKASQIATKPNTIQSASINFKHDEEQNNADLEKEDTDTPIQPPTPLNLVNNDEDQTKTGSEEEDMVTTDEEDEKDVRKDPTYKPKITVEGNNKRVTRSTKDPSTPHCSLITSTQHS
jgi:hypothetical protein